MMQFSTVPQAYVLVFQALDNQNVEDVGKDMFALSPQRISTAPNIKISTLLKFSRLDKMVEHVAGT